MVALNGFGLQAGSGGILSTGQMGPKSTWPTTVPLTETFAREEPSPLMVAREKTRAPTKKPTLTLTLLDLIATILKSNFARV